MEPGPPPSRWSLPRWLRRPAHALPPPWYQRRAVWAGAGAVALLVLWGALATTRDEEPTELPVAVPSTTTSSATASTAAPTTTTTAPASAPAAECIEVANPSLLVTIDAEQASAVELDDGWFVAKANGATWFTTANPHRDAEGELVPMNDQARADSESRRDLPPGDPLYQGHTDDEPAAEAARACAGG